jgi:hypothetical protein
MPNNFFAGLLNGSVRMPDAAINYGSSPLPVIPPGASQFTSADGRYNAGGSLLPGGIGAPYAYGTSARISTQTQMAHPNRVALIVPKLRIPSPESDGLDHTDPLLQHAISDGDLVFSFRMGTHMSSDTTRYYLAPHGCANRAVQLINLATVNYILWGLQVGLRGPKASRWRAFFNNLTRIGLKLGTVIDEDVVWNFIQTYLRPFGIQHGGDQQGGMHEGDDNRVVTHGAVDYVSSFAIEGKLRHVNNLWRDLDVRENDDLMLALRFKAPPHSDLQFVLSSSVRATRNERVSVSSGFYYLRPEVLQHRSFSDVPYIHIGRSQLYCSAYTRGVEACCWNARIPVTPGAPLLLTFEPCFVNSDRMFYRLHELEDDDDDAAPSSSAEDSNAPTLLLGDVAMMVAGDHRLARVPGHALGRTGAPLQPPAAAAPAAPAAAAPVAPPPPTAARATTTAPGTVVSRGGQQPPAKKQKPAASTVAGILASVLQPQQ